MLTNASITLYLYANGAYTRKIIDKVFWSDSKQSNVKESGLANADTVKIMIPTQEDIEFTTSKDLVVKGNCDMELDTTTSQTLSASKKALNDAYNVYTVNCADDKRYGSKKMWHYDLSCR